jgi:hypothetical protein
VLKNAVGGIAEIITYPGPGQRRLRRRAHGDGRNGSRHDGFGLAAGVDRARIAAEQAVASPLLEGVNLSGAKGVLVNITAAKGGLKMKEVNEVMNTVKAFAADDAHIIFGAVYDEMMDDEIARHGGRHRPRPGCGARAPELRGGQHHRCPGGGDRNARCPALCRSGHYYDRAFP